jgi:cell division inhibitor SepF
MAAEGLKAKVSEFFGFDVLEEEMHDGEFEDQFIDESEYTREVPKDDSSNVVTMPNKGRFMEKNEVLVIEPEYFNDAPSVCTELKEGKTIVVNLEKADYEDAKKIFDFLNGAVFALNGSINKVAENVFILAPNAVDVLTASVSSEEANYNDAILNFED